MRYPNPAISPTVSESTETRRSRSARSKRSAGPATCYGRAASGLGAAFLAAALAFLAPLPSNGPALAQGLNEDSGPATLTIADAEAEADDTAPSLTVDNPSVVEGDDGTTTLTFTATLDRPSARTIDGMYEALYRPGDTATAGADYRTTSGMLTFAPGETSKTVDVTVIGDTEREDDETFTVFWLIWDSGYRFRANAFATGTIEDDDNAALTIADAKADEGDALTFTVTLDKAVPGGLTVTPSFTDGTATKGTDYTANTKTLTFSGTAGETQTFSVSTTEDEDMEGNETFTVGLAVSGTTQRVTATSTATGTITNDDSAAVTIADASADEGKAIAFTVTLDNAVPGGFNVTPTFTDGTATEGTDYTANTTALEFVGTAGESVIFTVPTTDDPDAEANETFTVGLTVSGTTHSVTATATATGTITNDDTATTPHPAAVTIADASADEGDALTFTVTLDAAVSGGLTVTPSFTDGTATKGTDYTENTNALSFTGTAGETVSFTVPTTQDGDVEEDETFTVGLSVSGTTHTVTATSTATGTIKNEDEAVGARAEEGASAASATISLSSSVTSRNEKDGAVTVTITATASSDWIYDRAVTVYVGYQNDTATEGTDYNTVNSFTIRITAFETDGTGTFTLTPKQDNLVEGDETITIGGTEPNETVGSTTITLTDDEIALSVAPTGGVLETSPERNVAVTVTGSALNHSRTVAVSVGKSGDSATEGTDYNTVANFNITVPANTSSATGTFWFTPKDDNSAEGNETITISGTSTGYNVVSTSMTLIDNDVSLSVSPSSWGEQSASTSVRVTATSGANPQARTVRIYVGKGSDSVKEGINYANVPDFDITIPANATSGAADFTLTPYDDGVHRWGTAISIYGILPGAHVSGAWFTLTDDDYEPDFIIGVDKSSVSESGGAQTITVTVRDNRDETHGWIDVDIGVGKSHDSATEGTDYATVNDFRILGESNARSASGTFTLTPTNDSTPEGTERILVYSTDNSIHQYNPVAINLTDDDGGTITLSTDVSSVREDASATKVTITATADKQQPAARTLNVSLGSSGSATYGTDYTVGPNGHSFTLQIGKNQTSGTAWFNLTPTNDTVVEGNETMGISATSPGFSITGTSVTLTDDDYHAVTLSANKSSVAESASATTVTVTATAKKAVSTARTVTVAVGSSTDGATEGTDYATVDNFDITIAANSKTGTGTFTLTPTEDTSVEGSETIGISGSGTLTNVTGTSMTLTDNDTYAVTLSASPTSVAEDASATTVTVTASATAISTARTVSVVVGASTDSAIEGTDYATVADTTITIAANAASGTVTFTLTPTDDSSVEGDETISISGSGTLMTVTGTSMTLSDDDVRTITLSSNKTTVSEGAGATTVTVTATANSAVSEATTVTVSVGASGDGATSGTDYTAVTDFDITIVASATKGTSTFTLTPTDDSTYEGEESVSISGTSSPHTVTGTSLAIGNNDGIAITLSAAPDSLLEGGGSTSVTVTATAATSALADIDVDVSVGKSSDSATEGTDYPTVNDFELTIAEGDSTGTATFNVIPNSDKRSSESDETISVEGSSSPHTVTGTSLTLQNASATNPITLSVNPSSVGEGAGATTVTVNAKMHSSFVASIDMTVTVGTSGSATSGTDYAAVSDFTLTFAANSTTASGTFTLTPTDDSVVEANETVWVDGSSTGREVVGTSVTINDDDGAGITLSASPSSVSEGASATTVTVTATPANTSSSARTVTVSVGKTGDAAISGTDYADVSDFDITIAANAASQTGTFTLTPTQDTVVEGSESLTIAGSGTGLNVTGTSVSLTDDDTAPAVNLSVSPSSVTEGATDPLSLTSDGPTVTVTAAFSNSNTYDHDKIVAVSVGGSGSATSGTDYTAVSDFNVKISAGQKSGTGTFRLTSSDDSVYEGDETIGVAGTSSGLTVNSATLTLDDNDSAAVTVDDASATEGDSLTFTVTLDTAVQGGLTVTPSFTDVTATEGTDYDENTAALSFTGTAGETKTFTVSTTDDDVVESTETFTVGLSVSDAPSGVTSTDTGTGTINVAAGNSRDVAAVTINDASADEGGSITFTVTLDNAVQGGLTVTPTFTDVTAVEGTDYDENTTALSFTGTAGETKTFDVSTTEDAVLESDETFTVGLSVSGTTLSGSITSTDTGTGTINNDDSVSVTVNDASADEGDSMTFTVTLDAAVQGGLTVTPTFTDVTAVEGTDYDENTTALSFAGTAGETKTFTVETTEDVVLESDETFTVGLSVSGTTLSASITSTDTGTGTIDNDDTVSVTVNDASAEEGDDMTFTVTLSAAVQGGLTVTPGYADGTAAEGTDYDENTAALSFTGTAGETKDFDVSTTEDAVLEADETFTVSLSVSNAPSGVTSTDTGTGTIEDDDSAEVTIGDADADEGDAITFTVTLDNAVQGGLIVTPGYTNGTAASGDYTANTAALTFTGTKGETKTFDVSTTEDEVLEADETFTVGLTVANAPSGTTVTSSDTGEGTIENDDSAEVTVSDADADEGNDMTFTVTLSEAVQGGLTVTPSFTDGTADEGTDYDENTAALTFTGTKGETKTFDVSTTEDDVLEANETFTVGLAASKAPSGTTVTSSDTGTGTINNDDGATVTVDNASADEGDAITFTVTLGAAIQGGLTVTPSFTDGTADEGTDYDENTSALDFTGTKGETKTFTVQTTQDAVFEADEIFTVDLTVSGTTLDVDDDDTGTGKIENDDSASVTVNDAKAAEGDSLTFTVTLDNAVQDGLKVTPGFTNGTAVDSTDYKANTTALTFTGTKGETQQFTVATTEDAVVEYEETFTATLAVSDAPAAGIDASDTGTGTIEDDDTAEVSVNDASAEEGGAVAFTITLSEAVQGGLTVTPSYANGTAASNDYTANTTPIVFAGTKGETQQFTVATIEDAVLEGNETFAVSLAVSNAPPGVTAAASTPASTPGADKASARALAANATSASAGGTGTINNNDTAEVTIDDAGAPEGEAITFTVTLDNAVQGGLTVTPGYADSTAVEGSDYDANTAALSFTGTSGETKTFDVATTEDVTVEGDETFSVALAVSGTALGVAAGDTGAGTIRNDDRGALTVSSATAFEGESLTFSVTLDAAVQDGLVVTPLFIDGTATKGADYEENAAPLRFDGTAGETKTFDVATIQDDRFEGDEAFLVRLHGAKPGISTRDAGTGTIHDDDGAAVVIGDASADEGERMIFIVTLSEAVAGGLTVTPFFTDGTATAGADYEENVTPLKFNGTAGETWTFTVSTVQDDVFEGDETFTVGLVASDAPYGLAAGDTGAGTIRDDDENEDGGTGEGDDGERPGVAVTGPSDVQRGAFDVTITFTEAVTGFERDDLTVGNGEVTAFSGSDSSYAATISPAAAGTVTVDVAENAAEDREGNGNTEAERFTVEADPDRPGVVIAGPSAVQHGAFDVTITFTEAVTGFERDDLTVGNGEVTAFSGSDSSYAATISPAAAGTVTVDVAENAAEDRAGNGNTAAERFAVEADPDRPGATIAGPSDVQRGAFDVTIAFTEAVTGFERDDLTVGNGEVSAFSGSGADYAATITPVTSGTVTVDVAENAAEDRAGNGNTAAEQYAVEADPDRPSVAIAGPSDVQYGAFDVTIAFTEAVTGFERDDLAVGNGEVSAFSGSDSSYAATISPAAAGTVTVDVAENAAEDRAGNGNTAAERFAATVETSSLVLAPVSGLATTEAGAVDTLAVALNRRPTGEVTLSASSSDETEGVASPASLVFTPDDWNVPQFVIVGGVADFLIDGDQAYALDLSVSSSKDAGFAAMAPVSVPATGVDLTLRDLSVAPGRQSPAYSPPVTEYDVTVPNGIGCVEVHARTARGAAPSIAVNGRVVGNEIHCGDGGTSAGSPMTVDVGTMRIEVDAPEAVYVVNVTRQENAAPSAPVLADQTATAGTAFDYVFAPATDPDGGQRLTYAATLEGGGALPSWLSFDPEARAFSGTPAGADVGARVIVVTVTDDGAPPLSSRASFTLTVVPAPIDGRPLQLALASFGRAVASDAVSVMESRFSSPVGRSSSVTLGGQQLQAGRGAGGVASLLYGLSRAAGLEVRLPRTDGQSAMDASAAFAARHVAGSPARAQPGRGSDQGELIRFNRRSMGEVLSASSFELTPAQSDAGGAPSPWSLWGRGGASGFSGRTGDGASLDGRVSSAYLGIDYRFEAPVTLGLAFSRSAGEIDYLDDDAGTVVADLSMMALMPYAHWSASPRLDLWGFGSAGWGEAELEAESGGGSTDFSLRMAALGLRNALGRAGAVGLALKGDAFVVGIESKETEDLAAAKADVQRVRLALEGTADYAVGAASTVTPRLALGGRLDGGTVENGFGAEIEGGLTWMHAASGWGVEGRGRHLLLHQEADFEDWSASARLFFDPGSRDRGLFIALSPEWGNPNGGGNVLWDRAGAFGAPSGPDRAPAAGWNPQSIDLEIGYGAGAPGRLLTSYGGVRTLERGEANYRLGGRMEVGRLVFLGLEGERRTSPEGPPESRVMLMGRANW